MDPSVYIYGVIITIITILGSTGAWRFYTIRAAAKDKKEDFLKDEYKERIDKLEQHLKDASIEKQNLREQILTLTAEVSKLKVKVEYLEKEKDALMLRNSLIIKNYNEGKID